MPPQSPYGPPQPYNQDGQPGSQPPYAPPNGQPFPPAQPGQASSPYPATQYPQPGPTALPGQGMPAVPAYIPPESLRGQPSQPNNLPPPPPAATTPYDFFMNQQKPGVSADPLSPNGKKLGSLPTPQGGLGTNKFLLAGITAVVIIFGLILYAIFSPKDTVAPGWFAIAQHQQEVIRLCTQGTKAKFQSTRNFAITCQTSVTSDQRALLAYMNEFKLEYNDKELGLKANTQVDAKLKAASSTSAFDSIFRDSIEAQLNTYDRALASHTASVTGQKGKAVLAKSQQNLDLLILSVKDDSDKTEASGE